ncbi:hypothetical protein N7489_004692 [Penicillium chrysogenum]|uniref:uncharacterized protein n=1 Tax=Penicillium chrysogenum TaxID=5076 RepID=UPI0024DF2203|nr:uncharacterized protein N7489_004692 [Penicillium chrysogenum]KAJ5244596.1 hypothetical protein N7489_004692 [Penicillium chrysogenum]
MCGLFAAPGLATAPVLSSVRFTTGRIQARSTTAAAHGLIGNIAAGNATAIGQSAGALVIVNRARQLGGVLRSLTMGSVSLAWVKTRL